MKRLQETTGGRSAAAPDRWLSVLLSYFGEFDAIFGNSTAVKEGGPMCVCACVCMCVRERERERERDRVSQKERG